MPNPGDQGVDLASYQHPGGVGIDYRQLAQAKKFAYVQLTDSTNYQNPYCVTDVRGCQAAGLETGAYHFWRPDDSFDQQVNDFTKLYLAIGGFTLPPMIDCETESVNGWAWTANQLGLLQTNIRTALGTDVGVYLNDSFYAAMPGCPWGWPLWLADPSHPNAPTYPCTLQQTGTGSVPGIAAPTDLDVWRTSVGPNPPLPEGIDDDMITTILHPDGTVDVFYVGVDGNINQLNRNAQNAWTHFPISVLSGTNAPAFTK